MRSDDLELLGCGVSAGYLMRLRLWRDMIERGAFSKVDELARGAKVERK